MSGDNKPIGWWLKELDGLLESSFERLLAADGLTRRQWQALNAAAGDEQIGVALAPFLDGNPETIAAIIEPLVARGWLVGEELTPSGQAALTGLTAKVRAQRERVTADVSADEYAATIDVLRRMAQNLAAT